MVAHGTVTCLLAHFNWEKHRLLLLFYDTVSIPLRAQYVIKIEGY